MVNSFVPLFDSASTLTKHLDSMVEEDSKSAVELVEEPLQDLDEGSDDEEEREYQLLASQLFKFPPLPVFAF